MYGGGYRRKCRPGHRHRRGYRHRHRQRYKHMHKRMRRHRPPTCTPAGNSSSSPSVTWHALSQAHMHQCGDTRCMLRCKHLRRHIDGTMTAQSTPFVQKLPPQVLAKHGPLERPAHTSPQPAPHGLSSHYPTAHAVPHQQARFSASQMHPLWRPAAQRTACHVQHTALRN